MSTHEKAGESPAAPESPLTELYHDVGNVSGEQGAFCHCLLEAAHYQIPLWRFVEDVLVPVATEDELAASDASYMRGFLAALWMTLEEIGAIKVDFSTGVCTLNPWFEMSLSSNLKWCGHDRLCPEPMLAMSFVTRAARAWADRRDAGARTSR